MVEDGDAINKVLQNLCGFGGRAGFGRKLVEDIRKDSLLDRWNHRTCDPSPEASERECKQCKRAWEQIRSLPDLLRSAQQVSSREKPSEGIPPSSRLPTSHHLVDKQKKCN